MEQRLRICQQVGIELEDFLQGRWVNVEVSVFRWLFHGLKRDVPVMPEVGN
jgi:hypothetical protein